MKPARLAHVYVFQASSEKESLADTERAYAEQRPLDMSNLFRSASMFYTNSVRKLTASGPCEEVTKRVEARNLTMLWAHDNARNQAGETIADEEGDFAFTESEPGLWHVVVNGRVGMSDAIWEQTINIPARISLADKNGPNDVSNMIFSPAERVFVKMLSPEYSCPAE